MRQNDDDELVLTFDEANQVYGSGEMNPALVLRALYDRHKQHLHAGIVHELRILLKGNKIIRAIKSEDVRNIVTGLNSRFLREQFHGKALIDCSSLHYLFSIFWHFRHCKNMNDVAKAGRDRHFISKFREQLLGSGIAVQYELFELVGDEFIPIEEC